MTLSLLGSVLTNTATASQDEEGAANRGQADESAFIGGQSSELQVCKIAGSGVEGGEPSRFTANGRPFTLAAEASPTGACTKLPFRDGEIVTVDENVPSRTYVSINAVRPAALLRSDPVAGIAVVRIGVGTTTVRFTNAVCDEAAVMRGDEPVLPAGATDVEGSVDVDQDRGLLSTLYPGFDTTTDEFYPLPCEPSLGGTLPSEVDVPLSQDELDAEKYLAEFERTRGPEIVAGIKPVKTTLIPPLPEARCSIVSLGALDNVVPCDSPRFLRAGQPFEGRDIIYVHGLATEHLKKWIGNDGPARKLWPQDASEFLDSNGYFREYAENYWRDHIRENLFDAGNPSSGIAGWQWTSADSAPRYNPKSNRYLAVAWSSNQTIERAQHTLLTQIQLAITSNKNVVTPPTYPSTHVRPFCSNGCIIIGHSTGPLVTSTAMALADMDRFGPGGKQIARQIRTHVSFEGAISGSRLASIGMAIGLTNGKVPRQLCAVFDDLLGIANSCIGDTGFVANSILRDLMPIVAQGVWGPLVLDRSPVPTVTVAGGHPTGNYAGLTKFLLPGLDDGVVSMNSACGNPNPVFPGVLAPSGATVTSLLKAFEMAKTNGLRNRAVSNFRSHKNLVAGARPSSNYLAGACTPYLSPTGMVMPIAVVLPGTKWDARKRYRNHFSLLQGSIDHAYDGATANGNKWPSETGDPANTTRRYIQQLQNGPNIEESSAITNRAIFTRYPDGTYLVHPSFAKMHEIVRGKKIPFGKKRAVWIWKRTYHLLDKWELKQSSHYVYEFVGRR